MTDGDMERLERRLDQMQDKLTSLITEQFRSLCEDVRVLQTQQLQTDRKLRRLFEMTDWIPRLQGALALLVALVPIILWLASQMR